MRRILSSVAVLAFTVAGFAQSTLFEQVDPKRSGIDFHNKVIDMEEVNPFLYDNIYSGSGVAIGDINNDGLLDIYLGGNQVGDELYLNKGKFKFQKITEKAGIQNKGGWTTGVTLVDINKDGLLDIYVCKSLYDESTDLRTNELYINNGNSTFTESAAKFGLNDSWRSQQAVFLDFDKDNDLDLFLVNQPPNPGILSELKGKDWRYPALGCKLLRNDGDTFTDVSQDANVFDRGYGLSATTGDFNNDGWPDLYVSNDYNNPDFLYINQQNGTFINTIDESMGHISYFSMGIDVADINNDNLMDIFTVDMVPEDNYNLKANMGGMYPAAFWETVNNGGHYQYMLNTLQLNRGVNASEINVFSEIAQLIGAAYTDWSWSPLIADFDNDGQKDIFVTNGLVRDLRNTDALKNINNYLKERTSQLQKIRQAKGNIWDVISLDTLLSFYPVRKIPNYSFKNNGDLGFKQSTSNWGLEDPAFSTGAAYGDLDNDGDLDLIVSNINDPAFVYVNNSETSNSLRVRLQGDDILFGSKVSISTNGQKQTFEFANSRGFYSSSEAVAHFGIGEATKVDEVEITWTDGTVNKLTNVKAGQIDVKKEGGVRMSENESPLAYFSPAKISPEATHVENSFDDYEREVLLPHQMSMEGPIVAVADLNDDGSDEFYLPGPIGSGGSLNHSSGHSFTINTELEEVAALFFDADNDGDDDLIVLTGGNEYEPGDGRYQDLFYENVNGKLVPLESLPANPFSGSIAISADIDGDGDEDLFLGGRQVPGAYPSKASSFIYRNLFKETGKVAFEDASADLAPELEKIGMVTSATWSDFDQDNDKDLVLVGEWMGVLVLENTEGNFKSVATSLANETGWWNHIKAVDLDNDGDEDYLVGNLGLNYKFQASKDEPFIVYYDDFDENGKNDIVLSYYNFGEQYPVRGRSCSSQQIPEIKKKFENYHSFASANIFEVYGEQALNESLTLEVTNFNNSYIENLGGGKFRLAPLPAVCQLSPINSTAVYDLNEDGLPDIIYAGNKYGSEVETPRADAGIGGVLINRGNFNFEPVEPSESGLFLNNHVKDLRIIKRDGKDFLLVASNNDQVRLFEITTYGQIKN